MSASDKYLESEVMSASQPKLWLMLIEAALRLARRASDLDPQRDAEEHYQTLSKLSKIVTHLLQSIQGSGNPLTEQFRSVYARLFRLVAVARLQCDQEPMLELVSILEIEQETWRTVVAEGAGMHHADGQIDRPGPAVEFAETVAVRAGAGSESAGSLSFQA